MLWGNRNKARDDWSSEGIIDRLLNTFNFQTFTWYPDFAKLSKEILLNISINIEKYSVSVARLLHFINADGFCEKNKIKINMYKMTLMQPGCES